MLVYYKETQSEPHIKQSEIRLEIALSDADT